MWLAGILTDFGYKDQATADIIERWRVARTDAWVGEKSAAYLRNSGQVEDLDFILDHVDHLQAVFSLRDSEVDCEAGLRNARICVNPGRRP